MTLGVLCNLVEKVEGNRCVASRFDSCASVRIAVRESVSEINMKRM